MKFVVLGSQRSGTVYLEELISSHPDAHCWGEVLLGMDGPTAVGYPAALHRRRVLRHIWRHVGSGSATNPRGVITKALSIPPLPAVGFRLMYNQVNRRVRSALSDSEVAVIHVTRVNLIRQFVSLQQMRARQGQLGAGSAHARSQTKFAAVQVDPAKAIAFARSREAERERLLDEFRSRIILDLSYEDDILGHGNPTLSNRLTDALGLSPAPMRSKTQQSGSTNLADAVVNYREFREAVLASSYSWALS